MTAEEGDRTMSQQTAPARATGTASRIERGPVATGCYIGVFDKPMHRHRIAATERRCYYLPEPEGPGGHWAFTLCRQAAWHSDIVSTGARQLPECKDCAALAVGQALPRS